MGVRFAPSPTGRFHIGNLRSAWISFQFSKSLGLPWVVRFEDIDQPRVLPGAMENQLEDMKKLGLTPSIVQIQSHFQRRHLNAFQDLIKLNYIYPCYCSRKKVKEALGRIASAPHTLAAIYDGTCRTAGLQATSQPTGWRFRMPDNKGDQDFIVARASVLANGLPAEDFCPAYTFACAVDDYDGNYKLLVRAWDLEHVITQQRAIGSALGFSNHPAVFHTSLVVDNKGHRLEKRTAGVTLPELQHISAQGLIELFITSFDGNLLQEYAPSKVWGEARKQITLKELNLRPEHI